MSNLFTFYCVEKRSIKYIVEAETAKEAVESFESGEIDFMDGRIIDDELEDYSVFDEQRKEWVKNSI